MTSFKKVALGKVALVLSFCALGVASVGDADAQRRSRGMTQSSDTDFYVVARGSYPFTSITRIGGAGILGFGYRADEIFRAELELIYGAITAEVEESGSGPVRPNPFAGASQTNPTLIDPTIPVNFEADNDNFLFMANFYIDMPFFPKQWRVKPYVGFSFGYANTNTTPDYGNAGDVADAAVPVAAGFERLINPASANTNPLKGAGQTYLTNVYNAIPAALKTAASLPNALNYTVGTGATQFGGQAQSLARALAYATIAQGIVNGGNAPNPANNNALEFVPGIKQNIPVGELQSLVVGAMAGFTVDVGHNIFVDTGYRFMRAQKEIKNFHEIRFGVGYNFAVNY